MEEGFTNLYVADRKFNQCKYLILNIPSDEIDTLDELGSIDEAAEFLDHSLEGLKPYQYQIPPETEFWAHCSNLQVWYESGYDTRLLHRNLAFSLLKRLTDVGDNKARNALKDEIFSRYLSDYTPVKLFLIENNYLFYLTQEELKSIVDNEDLEEIRKKYFLQDFYSLYNFGLIYVQLGMEHKAVEIIDYIKTANPNKSRAWYYTAHLYSRIYALTRSKNKPSPKYLDLAISDMAHVVRLEPSSYDALTALGSYHSRRHEFDIAEKLLQDSLKLNPEYVVSWTSLGVLNFRLKNYKKAIEMYERAREIDPYMNSIFDFFAESFYYDKKYQESIKYAKKQLERTPRHYEALYFLGSSLYKLGRYREAISHYNLALDCDIWYKTEFTTTDHDIRKKLCKCYFEVQEHTKAISIARKILDLEPNNQTYLDLVNSIKEKMPNTGKL